MRALHVAVVAMMTAGKWNVTRRAGTNPFTVEIILGLLTKAIKTFRSVELLARRGLHEDANALVRVLTETATATTFILQTRSRERALGYYAHSLSQSLKMIREWKRTPGLKRRVSSKKIKEVEEALESIVSCLPTGYDFRNHWSGKGSLQNALKSLRADSVYSVLYRHTSSIAHASDVGLHFVNDANTGTLIWQIQPRSRGVLPVILVSTELLWVLASRINERLGLGFDSSLLQHKVTRGRLAAAARIVPSDL